MSVIWHWNTRGSAVAWCLPALAIVRWNWTQDQEAVEAPGIQNLSPHSTYGITDHSGVLDLGGWIMFHTGKIIILFNLASNISFHCFPLEKRGTVFPDSSHCCCEIRWLYLWQGKCLAMLKIPFVAIVFHFLSGHAALNLGASCKSHLTP